MNDNKSDQTDLLVLALLMLIAAVVVMPLTGHAAPVSYPINVSGGGGGGGLEVATLTGTTGEIAASGTAQHNLAIPSNNALIVGIKIERTAGAATSVSATAFQSDVFGAFSDELCDLIGSGFSAATIGVNPIYGPKTAIGGSTASPVCFYHDADGTSELHLQIKNGDGAEAGTFFYTVLYIDLGDF